MPDVFRHLLNSIPIYVGFALLGVAVFWQAYRFRSFNIAVYTLFALSSGDEVANTFFEICQIHLLFGFLYMFCFLFFSINVIINIFLIVIGDAYAVIKNRDKYEWL